MKALPPRAAAVVVALALLATVVTGREQRPPEVVATVAPSAAARVPAPEPMDLRLPVRVRDEGALTDLFAGAAPTPVDRPAIPAAAVQQVPAVPSAPPLPFRFIGRMNKAGKDYVYLAKGEEVVVAESGKMLEASYRVESITRASVQLVYVPLGTVQSLAIPGDR